MPERSSISTVSRPSEAIGRASPRASPRPPGRAGSAGRTRWRRSRVGLAGTWRGWPPTLTVRRASWNASTYSGSTTRLNWGSIAGRRSSRPAGQAHRLQEAVRMREVELGLQWLGEGRSLSHAGGDPQLVTRGWRRRTSRAADHLVGPGRWPTCTSSRYFSIHSSSSPTGRSPPGDGPPSSGASRRPRGW